MGFRVTFLRRGAIRFVRARHRVRQAIGFERRPRRAASQFRAPAPSVGDIPQPLRILGTSLPTRSAWRGCLVTVETVAAIASPCCSRATSATVRDYCSDLADDSARKYMGACPHTAAGTAHLLSRRTTVRPSAGPSIRDRRSLHPPAHRCPSYWHQAPTQGCQELRREH